MATVEEVRDAFKLKHEAEAQKALAEAQKALAEAKKLSAEAGKAELEYEAAQRREREELAANKHNLVYAFGGTVTDSSVSSCIDQLTIWMRTRPGEPITIVFYSPGGGVFSGMSLFDFICDLRRRGHVITTVAHGMAASMAGILMQAGDIRVCGKEAYLLIHEISFGTWGKVSEVEDEIKFVKRIQERVLNIFHERSKGKISKAFIRKNWKKKDWWLSSDDCLKYGIVDEVR